MFLTPEDLMQPTSLKLPEDEESPGLILSSGEINWNCPCLGGMATGPCGVEFRDAFTCFHFRLIFYLLIGQISPFPFMFHKNIYFYLILNYLFFIYAVNQNQRGVIAMKLLKPCKIAWFSTPLSMEIGQKMTEVVMIP